MLRSSLQIREHGQQSPNPRPRPHTQRGRAGIRSPMVIDACERWAGGWADPPKRRLSRELSDAELVVAQGQENSARLDLSYIERALFAISIEDRGFDREVIMAALTIEKTQLSRLISIGRAIPIEVVQLIGPAPDQADACDGHCWPRRLPRATLDPSWKNWRLTMTSGTQTSDARFVFVPFRNRHENRRASSEKSMER